MAAFRVGTTIILVLAVVLRLHSAAAQGTHGHVEDLSPACLTRLNDIYALYTNTEGGDAENPCINTLQRALVGRTDAGCPEAADMQACFAEHASEWTAFDNACEMLHYHDEEDHEHEGDATHAHAPGEEEHDHGDDHEVEDGCLPSFETRADFAAYTFTEPANQSASRKEGGSGNVATTGIMLMAAVTAAVAANI